MNLASSPIDEESKENEDRKMKEILLSNLCKKREKEKEIDASDARAEMLEHRASRLSMGRGGGGGMHYCARQPHLWSCVRW